MLENFDFLGSKKDKNTGREGAANVAVSTRTVKFTTR